MSTLCRTVNNEVGGNLGEWIKKKNNETTNRSNDISLIAGQLDSYISFVDFVFWFVAVFAAVFLARRPLSRSDKLAIGMYELKR
jgi:hypothetical protein